jgi:uncharacterized protein involved in propanediol utilization
MAPDLTSTASTGFPGHFGELLQGVLGPDGPVVLVTLPMRTPVIRLIRDKIVALDEWGQGLGLSTAALRAQFHRDRPDADLADEIAFCLASEGASDPMMLPDPVAVLWASRRGQVMNSFAQPPDFDLLCGLWGEGQATDPADNRFADVSDLVQAWPGALSDVQMLAQLAAASAQRCLSLRGPVGDPTEGIAHTLGAPGFQIAHTGSARGMIFAPGTVPETGKSLLQNAGFRRVRVLHFRQGWLQET